MHRRRFIALVGAAITAARTLRAQQKTMSVIGYLTGTTPEANAPLLAAFRQGLRETGWVEGQNVAIEYRWAEFQYDRLPALATDLVGRKIDVLVACGGADEAFVAKDATSAIPIVFSTASDPVRIGLVASLNQPGGNATGISWLSAELAAKRLGLLRELIPTAADVALLINPADPTRAEFAAQDVEAAASASGLRIRTLKASSPGEIDASFAGLARDRVDALFVAPDILFNLRRVQLAILAATHRIPATYPVREFAEAGGLMSYGASIDDALRQAGIYAARILKGAKPADLPVLQPTKFEVVINLNTARALGLAVPSALLALADEVIE
jgi:putative tryptophan/tyrosine transport system substrate-binding protein